MSSYLVESRPWSEVRSRYDDHAKQMAPIIALIDWIAVENLENEIFATTSMYDLILSDSPSFPIGENMLRVSYSHSEKSFTFTYSRIDGSTDLMTKQVSSDDSIETFRQFLAYKFGIHRKLIQA